MSGAESNPRLSVQPVISWPRQIKPGELYEMVVDVQPAEDAEHWPFDDEEIVIRVQLLSSPVMKSGLLTDPALVLHRFGGTYGPVRYVLDAGDDPQAGSMSLALSNEAGHQFLVVELDVDVLTDPPEPPPTPVPTLTATQANAGRTAGSEVPVVASRTRPAVFVSYTHADGAWAEWIVWQLTEAGYEARAQAWAPASGTSWPTWMRRQVGDADHMMLLLSPDALRLGYVEAEWEAALRAGPPGLEGRLIPVRVGSCEWPNLLGGSIRIDLVDLAEVDARSALLDGVQATRLPQSHQESNAVTALSEHDRLTVFVSYTRADLAWAEWIAWQLAEEGYQPRLQEWHSVPGADFVAWIMQELAAAAFVVPVLSQAYVDSDWAAAEWSAAFAANPTERTQKIVPVRVEQCDPPALLRSLGIVDLVDLPEDAARRRLLNGLRRVWVGHVEPMRPPRFPGASGTAGAPRFPGSDREAGAALFLDSVVNALTDRHPGARIRRIPADGKAPAYLDVTVDDDGVSRRWPVGIAPHGLDRPLFEVFVEHVHAAYALNDPYVESELVCSSAADRALLREARRRGVRVRTLVEYQGLWDPRRYLARQAKRLAEDPVYPAHLYVPQRYVLLDEPPGAMPHDDVFGAVVDWLDSESARLVLVLGNFGHGKTFLLRELARQLPSHLPNLVPVLVDLRALEKSHSLDVLLAQHLVGAGEDAIDIRAVLRMLERGQLVLLFDGYDELALRVTYDRAAEHLRTVLSAVTGRAKVVLSSRAQHFASDDQVRTALGEQVRLVAGSRLVRLLDFDDAQIRAFLVRLYQGDEPAADTRLELIRDIRDLLGLSRNPRMLSFIAELDDNDLRRTQSDDGTISSADLYRALVDRWLGFEVARRSPTRGSMPGLDVHQMRRAVTALAVRLWQTTESSIDLTHLEETTRETLTDLARGRISMDEAAHAIGSGSLLVRDSRDTFRFVHSSVMEYLVAAEAARLLSAGDDWPALLSLRELSPLMVDFFCGIAGRDAGEELVAWARAVLMDPAAPAAATANALAVSQRLGVRVTGARLAGHDLRGHDLSGRDLRFADLSGADLRGVRLQDADLTGADLTRARLADAVFNGVRLTRADLTDADATGARLLRSDLIGARLEGSRWTGAVLLDTNIDHNVLTDRIFADAVISDRDPARADLRLPSGGAGCVTFSPNGTLLASAGNDKAIRLWELATGKQQALLQSQAGQVSSVAFSPDGATLAAGGSDAIIRLWSMATGEQQAFLTGHTGPVAPVAFSPDGGLLAATSDAVIRLWSMATGEQQALLTGHIGPVHSCAFSPDGALLASAGNDRTIRLWDVAAPATPRPLGQPLTGHTGPVYACVFSPDGRILVSAGNDRTIRIWYYIPKS